MCGDGLKPVKEWAGLPSAATRLDQNDSMTPCSMTGPGFADRVKRPTCEFVTLGFRTNSLLCHAKSVSLVAGHLF